MGVEGTFIIIIDGHRKVDYCDGLRPETIGLVGFFLSAPAIVISKETICRHKPCDSDARVQL